MQTSKPVHRHSVPSSHHFAHNKDMAHALHDRLQCHKKKQAWGLKITHWKRMIMLTSHEDHYCDQDDTSFSKEVVGHRGRDQP